MWGLFSQIEETTGGEGKRIWLWGIKARVNDVRPIDLATLVPYQFILQEFIPTGIWAFCFLPETPKINAACRKGDNPFVVITNRNRG